MTVSGSRSPDKGVRTEEGEMNMKYAKARKRHKCEEGNIELDALLILVLCMD